MMYVIVKNLQYDTFTLCSGTTVDDVYVGESELVVAEGDDKAELLETFPQAEDLT